MVPQNTERSALNHRCEQTIKHFNPVFVSTWKMHSNKYKHAWYVNEFVKWSLKFSENKYNFFMVKANVI